jgi:ABC-type xylose transport system substrate-binding protein
MNSDAVSYYATFDNYKVGTVQGTYVKDTLDLDNAAGPFNIEFTAGDPGDNNAGFFFNGAYDVLKPYIEEGKLNVVSGQKTFEEVATPSWATETAQSRAENILSSYYADGTELDVWLCSNDSTALGVTNALAANYNGKYPIVTDAIGTDDSDYVDISELTYYCEKTAKDFPVAKEKSTLNKEIDEGFKNPKVKSTDGSGRTPLGGETLEEDVAFNEWMHKRFK